VLTLFQAVNSQHQPYIKSVRKGKDIGTSEFCLALAENLPSINAFLM